MNIEKHSTTFFNSLGIQNVDLSSFSSRNLLIGKNGSGKTRFLKALEQEKFKNADKEVVVTLYFPEIQSFFQSNIESEASGPLTADLLIANDKLDFCDFLKKVENDNGNFLTSLLQMHGVTGSNISQKAKDALNRLNLLMNEFLKKELIVDYNSNTISIKRIDNIENDRCLEYNSALSEFSPGELMLFYLCIFLTVINTSSEKIILIIDEPETHLHPKMLVKFIEILKDSKRISELWIATHSLFLVPLFGFQEIVFLEQDQVAKHNSQLYKELYKALVGIENTNLLEFLKSIDNWQYYQYIVECFCLPEARDKVDAKDPQFQKLMDAIALKQKDGIRMLDYGAGKFRIWECMNLIAKSQLEANKISYTAYEPYPETSEESSETNEKDPKNKKEYPFTLYTDFQQLLDNNETFDIIVLMNVLHEVDASEWLSTFKKISTVLKDDGVLVFLEVFSLNNGEQPYGGTGYLLLQDEHVKQLFDNQNIINTTLSSTEKTNCWMITKEQISGVTNSTILSSIKGLYAWSERVLRECYEERIKMAHTDAPMSQKQIAARKYAFLSQQYLNAKFALEKLDSKKSKAEKPASTTPDKLTLKLKARNND